MKTLILLSALLFPLLSVTACSDDQSQAKETHKKGDDHGKPGHKH